MIIGRGWGVGLYYFSTFCFGVLFTSKNIVSYSHMIDFIGAKRAATYSNILFLFESVIFIVSPLTLKYLTKDTNVFIYASLALSILTILVMTKVGVLESLKFNLKKNNI
jgi:hypothetical protein